MIEYFGIPFIDGTRVNIQVAHQSQKDFLKAGFILHVKWPWTENHPCDDNGVAIPLNEDLFSSAPVETIKATLMMIKKLNNV